MDALVESAVAGDVEAQEGVLCGGVLGPVGLGPNVDPGRVHRRVVDPVCVVEELLELQRRHRAVHVGGVARVDEREHRQVANRRGPYDRRLHHRDAVLEPNVVDQHAGARDVLPDVGDPELRDHPALEEVHALDLDALVERPVGDVAAVDGVQPQLEHVELRAGVELAGDKDVAVHVHLARRGVDREDRREREVGGVPDDEVGVELDRRHRGGGAEDGQAVLRRRAENPVALHVDVHPPLEVDLGAGAGVVGEVDVRPKARV